MQNLEVNVNFMPAEIIMVKIITIWVDHTLCCVSDVHVNICTCTRTLPKVQASESDENFKTYQKWLLVSPSMPVGGSVPP